MLAPPLCSCAIFAKSPSFLGALEKPGCCCTVVSERRSVYTICFDPCISAKTLGVCFLRIWGLGPKPVIYSCCFLLDLHFETWSTLKMCCSEKCWLVKTEYWAVCEKVLEGGTVKAAVCPSFTQQLGKLRGDAFLNAPRGVFPTPHPLGK